jgi:uncharacterized protein (TIGR00297 family)
VPLPLAATVSAGVAWVAWRAGTLTLSGAVAAWTVGALVLYGTGWSGGAVLAAFFVSSSVVSRLEPTSPRAPLDSKGNRRDLWQVYANGGVAAGCAIAARGDVDLAVWLVTASLAAAAADTWATAVGIRSRQEPRLFGVGAPVARGTSGGMTVAGSAAAAAGAMLVAGTGALAGRMPLLLPAATLIGFGGMVVDSAAGAALQGRFHCPVCDEPSEWRIHRCGSPTVRQGGLEWLNNDGVNFIATAFAAGVALVCWRLLD